MKKLSKIDWGFYLKIGFAIFLMAVLLAFVVLEIYALIVYGGKPHDEIPGWVWWIWFGGK